MPYLYHRVIYLQETDAAGVVYFAHVLALCHEAYEASLAVSGIILKDFFTDPTTAIPIVYCQSDYFKPLHCGDGVEIKLTVAVISEQEFFTHYHIYVGDNKILVGKVTLKHCCIDPISRQRQNLPTTLQNWLKQLVN